AANLETGRGLFVTLMDSGGDFGLGDGDGSAARDEHRAWLAGLPALVKTAALVWPQAASKAGDIARLGRTPAQVAVAIADELFAGGGEIEVALAGDGSRWTLRSVAEAAQPGTPAIADGDVVVVSGGARGVTAACVIAWARRCPARFVLLGRTALADEPAYCAGI